MQQHIYGSKQIYNPILSIAVQAPGLLSITTNTIVLCLAKSRPVELKAGLTLRRSGGLPNSYAVQYMSSFSLIYLYGSMLKLKLKFVRQGRRYVHTKRNALFH